MYYPTSDTIRDAWDANNEVIDTATGELTQGAGSTINLSSILTYIIQAAGRYAERYASDFLLEWEKVTALTQFHHVEPVEDNIIVFGIRRDGVDGTGFLMSRCAENLNPYTDFIQIENIYRAVLAVRVKAEILADESARPGIIYNPAAITVELKDLTGYIRKFSRTEKDNWSPEREMAERGQMLRSYFYMLGKNKDITEHSQSVINAYINAYINGKDPDDSLLKPINMITANLLAQDKQMRDAQTTAEPATQTVNKRYFFLKDDEGDLDLIHVNNYDDNFTQRLYDAYAKWQSSQNSFEEVYDTLRFFGYDVEVLDCTVTKLS